MTEAEMLACDQLHVLMRFLELHHQKLSDRSLRLFVSACCRQKWDHFDSSSRHFVQMAERFADGLIGLDELARRRQEIEWIVRKLPSNTFNSPEEVACRICSGTLLWGGALSAAQSCSVIGEDGCQETRKANAARAEKQHIRFLRDIFDNPFHYPTIDPKWLAWNNGTVTKLAQAIYDESDLPSGHLDAGRLAILADALEEAGCAAKDILGHCRGSGPHVRGCWVIDRLLGKGYP